MTTTTTRRVHFPAGPILWHLRFCCALAVMLCAGSAFSATILIDHFDDDPAVELQVNPPIEINAVFYPDTDTDSDTANSSSLWGGTRTATLERTSASESEATMASFNGTIVSGLDFSEATEQTSTLTLEYGSDTLSGTDFDVVLDVLSANPGSVNSQYSVQLTVEAVGEAVSDVHTISFSNPIVNPPKFDLGGAEFSNVAAFFNNLTPIQFTFVFFAGEDADIALERIYLDNFQVESVPEPSAWTLAGVSLIGLCLIGYRSRRRRSA